MRPADLIVVDQAHSGAALGVSAVARGSTHRFAVLEPLAATLLDGAAFDFHREQAPTRIKDYEVAAKRRTRADSANLSG